ncbi:MAG: serine/threonine-protein kinase [Nannocystaceae bacterium]
MAEEADAGEAARTVASDGASGERTVTAPTRPHRAPPLGLGAVVGRYVILDRLGAGAMGVVHAAYDPELDRKIAIKLVDPGRRASARARSRLLREAQALARLSHPNVVTVHDVGAFEGRVFIAMELVDGATLSAWLAAQERSQRAILEVFVAAGRGLAAAHAAGLIHRDFKPDNVMIGADGRVRVMDFGLARAARGDAEDDELARPDAAPVGASTLNLRVTATAALIGTPAYMAPEQHLGQPLDARTDIFAFAVALYEALYGERPFKAESLVRLAMAVCAGDVAPPPPGARVPQRLRRALLRGLRVAPEDRYATIDELLHELERDPGVTPRRVAVAAIGAAAIAGLGWAVFGGEPPCADAQARWAEVWGDDARAAVSAAFAASGRGHATSTATRIGERLDLYGERWSDAHTAACEATELRGELSTQAMDLQMHCLQGRLDAAAALVGVLSTADGDVVDRAVDGVNALAPIDACRDVDALLAGHPLPEDPRAREELAALRRGLADADAEFAAGRFRGADELLEALTPRVEALDYAPLAAEFTGRRALLGARTRATDREERIWAAIDAAAMAGDRERYAEGLLSFVARSAPSRDEVEARLRLAESAVRLAGGGYALDLRLARARSSAYGELGELTEALTALDQARALVAAQEEPDVIELAHLAESRGVLLRRLGRTDEAREACAETARVYAEVYGPDHPYVANILIDQANLELTVGELPAAQANLERAVALRRAAFGPDNISVGQASYNLANVLRLRGDHPGARATLADARRIFATSAGPRSSLLAYVWEFEARLDFEAEDLAASRESLRKALAISTAGRGDEHVETVAARIALADLDLRDGARDAATAGLERARQILTANGESTVERVQLLIVEARLERARGRLDTARARLEEALAEADSRGDVEALDRADLELDLAALYAKDPARRARAGDLAKAAHTAYAAAGSAYATRRAGEAAALLAALRPAPR